ncbi:MAG: TIGR00730 family Rossman fold protein [Myxococcota bacterium]
MARLGRVLVFCASSRSCDPAYHEAASRLGRALARAGVGIVYGGGAHGSMGALAGGAIEHGGHVHGVLPHFMKDLEWGHEGLARLELVSDMRERKRRMLDAADAVVALPGGCGTLEELFEAITFKRLGLYTGPIVLVNTRGFFAPCVELLERCVAERFMSDAHRAMWCVVDEPEDVLPAIERAPAWSEAARGFAVS